MNPTVRYGYRYVLRAALAMTGASLIGGAMFMNVACGDENSSTQYDDGGNAYYDTSGDYAGEPSLDDDDAVDDDDDDATGSDDDDATGDDDDNDDGDDDNDDGDDDDDDDDATDDDDDTEPEPEDPLCFTDQDCPPGTACNKGECVSEELLCLEKPALAFYMSNDDSNSQSSPVLFREMMNGNVYGVGIRPWEFLNYFDIDYDEPTKELINVVPQLRPNPLAPDSFLLQVGVQSREVSNDERPLLNLTFSLDTSGSMEGQGLAMEKASMRALARRLRKGDIVSIVEWSVGQRVILEGHSASGPNDKKFLDAVESLTASGSTDLEAGLRRAYELATKHYSPTRLNRVVLMSDGGANAGITSIELIAKNANDKDRAGIYMAGAGMGYYYNDALMDQVTDAGKGAAFYIANADEAERMFNGRFMKNMGVAAMDVRVKVELPQGWQITRFAGEQISQDPKEVEPQHLAPGDSMVFNAVLNGCGSTPAESAKFKVTATFTDPATFERRQVVTEMSANDMLKADAKQLVKGTAIVAYADVAAAYSSRGWGDSNLSSACEVLSARLTEARELLPRDGDLAEIERVASETCGWAKRSALR